MQCIELVDIKYSFTEAIMCTNDHTNRYLSKQLFDKCHHSIKQLHGMEMKPRTVKSIVMQYILSQ